MIQLSISSFLVGAVFGLRFKVMAVLPLLLLGGFVIGMVSLVLGHGVTTLMLSLLAFVAATQAGYLFGSFTRFTLVAMRAARALPARPPLKKSTREA